MVSEKRLARRPANWQPVRGPVVITRFAPLKRLWWLM